ncbi:MAG: hypothetical protein KDB90_16575 [Planctomycetes bacterium]|nr:hypothetical protein [Planctomycetota bacterium]
MAQVLGDNTPAIADKTADADTSVTFTVGELATSYLLDYTAKDRFSSYQSIDNVESVLACKRLMYMYFRKLDLVNGNTLSGDFDSLFDIAGDVNSGSQIIDMSSAAPTLAKLQETYHLVVAGGAEANCIMCNSRASRAIIAAYNAAGLHPNRVEMEWVDPLTGGKKRQWMNAINGAPILINDMIETDGSNLTRIYMMVVGEVCDRQIHGVTGIVPKDLENKYFIRREAHEPSGATTSQTRVTYTFPVATAMGTGSALAILKNVVV